MRELTRAEEQIMQILWDLEKGFVKDILEKIEKGNLVIISKMIDSV